jgi:myo-inositol-1(or 4)-monophosphatase
LSFLLALFLQKEYDSQGKKGGNARMHTLLKQVEQVALDAGNLILQMEKPEIFVKEGHANFVTEADIASQKFCVEQLQKLLPEANFFAEEKEDNKLQPGYNWIIDPIDGTTNFMRGIRHSAISIGLVKDGEGVLGVVYDPYQKEMFSAVKGEGAFCNGKPMHVSSEPLESGQIFFGTTPYYREMAEKTCEKIREVFLKCADLRRSGSAALDLCYVAAGRCDGFFELLLSPWDYAASSVIIAEAGGKLDTTDREGFRYDRIVPIVAGNSVLFQELFDLIQK